MRQLSLNLDMMSVIQSVYKLNVRQLFLGNSNAFLISSGNEVVLVDGGLGDRSRLIIDAAKEMVPDFRGIKFAFVTHAHYDHVGSIDSIRNLAGASVIAHEYEAEKLEAGESPVPKGTMWFSRQISWLGCVLFRNCIRFNGFVPDLTFKQSLELPFAGDLIRCHHIPGHTKGSMGVEIGPWFFAGDTLFHLLPERVFPPFADDTLELLRSWEKIIMIGSKKIFPGHGRAISARLLQYCLHRAMTP